jgi:hypothetical protein
LSIFIDADGKEKRKKNSYLPVIGTSAVLCYIEKLKRQKVA